MAIQIIQRGVLPAAVRYKTECRHCNTIFSFLKSDAHLTGDQRDGDFYTIKCPVCSKDCHISAGGLKEYVPETMPKTEPRYTR